jgi:hypothetical protein
VIFRRGRGTELSRPALSLTISVARYSPGEPSGIAYDQFVLAAPGSVSAAVTRLRVDFQVPSD